MNLGLKFQKVYMNLPVVGPRIHAVSTLDAWDPEISRGPQRPVISTWKTAVATLISINLKTPKTSNPVAEQKWYFPMFSR